MNNRRLKRFVFASLSSSLVLSLANATEAKAESVDKETVYSVDLTDNEETIEGDQLSNLKLIVKDDNQFILEGTAFPNAEVLLEVDSLHTYENQTDDSGYFKLLIDQSVFLTATNVLLRVSSDEYTYEIELPIATTTLKEIELRKESFSSEVIEEFNEPDETIEKKPESVDNEVESDLLETNSDDLSEETEDIKTNDKQTEDDIESAPVQQEKTEDLKELLKPSNESLKENTEAIDEQSSEVVAESEMTEIEINDNAAESNLKEESIVQEQPMMFSAITTSSSVPGEHENGIYTVQSGDSLGRIAGLFGVTTSKLLEWNPQITNPNLIRVGQKIIVTQEAYDYSIKTPDEVYRPEERPFSTNTEFIEYLGKHAIEIANMEGRPQLYASVMVAQAIHESAFGRSSLSLPPYYNLFGIKGSYNGESVPMGTWEEENGRIVNITAQFRNYPSYYASMTDYANLLRNGLNWNRQFYAPTWVQNTTSYRDATAYLTGTYATDSQYAVKVNRIIEQYNLTRFDITTPVTPEIVANVSGSRATNYRAVILNSSHSINTLPWVNSGREELGKANEYAGLTVDVVRENSSGQYVLLQYDGELLGWVDARAVALPSVERNVSGSIETSYRVVVTNVDHSINTKPWVNSGREEIGRTTEYSGLTVNVVRKNSSGQYLLLEHEGELIGWVDHRAVELPSVVRNVSGSSSTLFRAVLNGSNHSINTMPWVNSGREEIGRTIDFSGLTVNVVRQNSSGQYFLIEHEGELLGWVDHRAISLPSVVSDVAGSLETFFHSVILDANHSINTMPWVNSGREEIGRTSIFSGLKVNVVKQNSSGQYFLLEHEGELLGWVDHRAVSKPNVVRDISGSSSISFQAVIGDANHSINTMPWVNEGKEQIGRTNDLKGLTVNVTRQNRSGQYLLIEREGVELGWVDYRALIR